MKLNKLIYVVPVSVLILAAGSGCRKSQFNINKNLNSPTDSTVTYDVVLPAAMNASASIIAYGGSPGGGGTVSNWGVLQNWMSYWSRSGTYAPNVSEETYQITTGFGTGVWNACYDNNYDLQIVQSKATQAGAGFYAGIAQILKAQNFQILVDVYGNIPYSQALHGSEIPTPGYDNGIDVYKGLFREIDAALALINDPVLGAAGSNANIATNDIMFHGNAASWNKFGNTLKLRMLIHCYAVAGIDKAAEMAIINANGNGFLTADASVNPGYSGNDKPNPFWTQYKTLTSGSGSSSDIYYAANDWGNRYYDYDVDPRNSQHLVYTNGGGGVPYGTPPIAQYASANVSHIGPGVYKSATASQIEFSAAESYFLQAEARQRNIITSGATAKDLLHSGIAASFAYYGVTGATAVDDYITLNATWPDVDYNGAVKVAGGPAGGLFTILTQKWLAMNGVNALETWTDWRRVPYSEVATKLGSGANAPTDHFVYGDGVQFDPGPARSVSPQITPSDNIPVRFLYPQTEYNYNTANVAAQGAITRYSKVFWDLN